MLTSMWSRTNPNIAKSDVAGPLGRAVIVVVLLLVLELSLESGHSVGCVGEVEGGLVRVVFRRPTCLLDQIVYCILDLSLVPDFFYFLFFSWVF